MNAQAVVERDGSSLAPVDARDLTPMQMAYQLAAQGVDPATVREMLSFGKELERDAAEKAFDQAMAAAQGEITVIATNMVNPQTRSRYVDYAKLDRALRPIYHRHGFALSFNDGEIARPEWVRIECYVSHVSGHTRIYHKDMPADGKGAKGNDVMTKTHAVGAAQSYAMRYLLRMIFNVAVGEEDRDGNPPSAGGEPITEAQRDELLALIEEVGGSAEIFCRYYKVQAVPELPANMFDRAKSALLKKKGA